MVAVKLQGRLGNQLFQYAFIYSLSRTLKTGFYIDQYAERLLIHRYFNIKISYLNQTLANLYAVKGYKNFFTFHLRRLIAGKLLQLTRLKKESFLSPDTNPADILARAGNNTLFEGYFQSEAFFKNNEAGIRQAFSLKPQLEKNFRDKYEALYSGQKNVCVHVRRTDYKNLGHLNLGGDDLSLPLEYYKKAISSFDGQNAQFIFVSDDVNFVNENFGDIPNKIISNDSEIMDFQHLLNADACIISNSTFSWWGAWLNNKPGKVVYAPQYFMGWRIKVENPAHICPPEWTRIDF